jgi:hypothetical protein
MATTDDDAVSRKKRKHEEEYFLKKDQELIEKMRKAAATQRARQDLEARTSLHDPDLLNDLDSLGFTADTVSLLPLVPLIQVAWAERSVSHAERRQIVALARARGVEHGSAADQLLDDWLSRRPPEEVFTRATRLIRAMLAAHSGEMHDLSADDLVKYCEGIASASGGIMGMGKVSVEEREALTQIAEQLKRA